MVGGYTKANQFGLALDYRQTVMDLVDYFESKSGVKVVLVPHVVAVSCKEEDDLRASQEVLKLRPNVEIAGPFVSAIAAKSFISGLDFFVGGRMHACIGAFSAGVPVVPMAYSRKFTGLFNTLGYAHVADCTKQSAEEVLAKVRTCFESRGTLLPLIAEGNRIARERLEVYKRFLAECIKEVASA